MDTLHTPRWFGRLYVFSKGGKESGWIYAFGWIDLGNTKISQMGSIVLMAHKESDSVPGWPRTSRFWEHKKKLFPKE